MEQIDRAVRNDLWVMPHGGITTQFLENYFSDHSPIQIDIIPGRTSTRAPVRFINALTDEENFLHLVEQV